jgi:hypothetical protein
MALGSFSSGALADLQPEDIERMLGLDETLFVEHKKGIGKDDSFKLVQAVAAFANTAGGWILVGVHEGKVVTGSEDSLPHDQDDGPTLVDQVRAHLRGRVDPLPAFEARTIAHRDGPIGVIRVYESSDTPHVVLETGAVYVREVAGVRDASDPKPTGGGARGDRAYRAAKIGSRAELLELAARGRVAEERVGGLLNTPTVFPLVSNGLGLRFEVLGDGTLRPQLTGNGHVFVRVAPYTLAPRFRGWATTLDAAGAVIEAGEDLADRHGLTSTWVDPDPAGASIAVPVTNPPHCDPFHRLDGEARVVVDGVGMAGAAFRLDAPDPTTGVLRRRFSPEDMAVGLIVPVIAAAASVLTAGEFLGRCRCQVDLVGMQSILLVEGQGDHVPGDEWVPSTSDITLPATGDELASVARRAANAYARSARLPFWDRTE